jgi:hypothetical protein
LPPRQVPVCDRLEPGGARNADNPQLSQGGATCTPGPAVARTGARPPTYSLPVPLPPASTANLLIDTESAPPFHAPQCGPASPPECASETARPAWRKLGVRHLGHRPKHTGELKAVSRDEKIVQFPVEAMRHAAAHDDLRHGRGRRTYEAQAGNSALTSRPSAPPTTHPETSAGTG